MIKHIIIKLALLLAITSLVSCSKEEYSQNNQSHEISHDFVQGSEDIPLLISMEKIKDEGLGFDSPSGSIMSSSYTSVLKMSKISKFYKTTLPQMGWTIEKNSPEGLTFVRENENLNINFSTQNNKTLIRFLISYDL